MYVGVMSSIYEVWLRHLWNTVKFWINQSIKNFFVLMYTLQIEKKCFQPSQQLEQWKVLSLQSPHFAHKWDFFQHHHNKWWKSLISCLQRCGWTRIAGKWKADVLIFNLYNVKHVVSHNKQSVTEASSALFLNHLHFSTQSLCYHVLIITCNL